jgi:streptogramin lyase
MSMRKNVQVLSSVLAWLMLVCLPAASYQMSKKSVESASQFSLAGVVSSSAEGPMEGVLVSAKRVGGSITVTVVSDERGRYRFPAGTLPAGNYRLRIRAVGYVLPVKSVALTAKGGASADLKLEPTSNLAPQLTSAEWMMSAPGSTQQKESLYGCLSCHSLQPVFESNYDPHGHVKLIGEMRNESPASNIEFSSKLPYFLGGRPADAKLAEYLSTLNLSGDRNHWDFNLSTLPRPKGKSTRVMITEYDLPRPGIMPSFAVMDKDGMVWYADFLAPVVGRLDPRTGKVREWPLPLVKPGFEPGSLCLKVGFDGNVWIARSFQGAVARFDPKTGKVTTWSEPKEYRNIHSRVSYLAPTPQGKVWFTDTFNRTLNLLDPATGKVSGWPGFPDWKWSWENDAGSGSHGKKAIGHFPYSMASDSRGWGYFTDEAGGNIGEVDPEGHVTLYPVPTDNAGPRLMHMDGDDRIWFGEDHAAKIGMFDTKTKQFKEWQDPFDLNDDYDAVPDKAGYVWTGGMVTDFVTRLDPKNGEMTQFLLPQLDVNMRALDVDNFTDPPSLLVGENHHAKIAIVTPLE